MKARFISYFVSTSVLLGCISLASTASAEEQNSTLADDGHQIALTISPFHLFSPIVEVQGEYKLAQQIGVSGIVGYGNTKAGDTDLPVFELGAQGRYYLLGDFNHGLHIGAEMLYVYVNGDDLEEGISVDGNGLAIGPFLGYKVAADFGLTFEIQAGYQALFLKAEAEAKDNQRLSTVGQSVQSDGNKATAEDEKGIPLLNINLGWSF